MSDISNEYKFVHFIEYEEQKEFIKNNHDAITKLIMVFFAHDNDHSTEIINDVLHNQNRDPYFFVMHSINIIGMCSIKMTGEIVMTNLKKIPKPYTLFSNLEDYISGMKENSKVLKPVIEALCKNPDYKNVGIFLLKNVKQILKSKGLSYVFLVPESSRYKKIGEDIECGILDHNKYYDSNMSLVDYYGKNEFEVLPSYFILDQCSDKKFVFINIMSAFLS